MHLHAVTSDSRRQLWRFAIGCALAVSLAHVAHDAATLHIRHEFTWTSRDFVWMAPVAYVLTFALIALLLTPLARYGRPVRTVVASFAAWAVLLLLLPRVYPLAVLLLSVGAGLQLARYVPSLRVVSALALGVGLVALSPVLRNLGARPLAAAPTSDAPNVLLLILDTVRARSLSLYGYHRPTSPNLERIAQQGVVFEHAFATSSWSLPSHASMLTGTWPHEQGGSYMQPIRADLRRVAEVFSAHGYTTGGFTANLGFVGHQTGLGKGFGTFQDFPRSWSQVFLTTTFSQTEAVRLAHANWRAGWLVGVVTAFHPRNLRLVGVRRAPHVDAAVIAQRFRTWRPAKGPWFAMLNMMDAHGPYVPPEPYRSRFGTSEHDRYDGAIVYIDSVVGSLVRELPSNTVIVITADHGEQWGEQGFSGHGNTLYLPVVHVPLVIAAANVAHGVRVDAPVTLRDVAATMLDLAGLPAELPGASLRQVWLGGTASPVFLEATQGKNVDATNQTAAGSIRGLLDSAAQYLVFADRREELYRWRTDDTTNVASDVDLSSYRQRLGAHYAR